MERRGFLKSILAAGVAPAAVASAVLMPVRNVWKPELTWYSEEIIIDTGKVIAPAEYPYGDAAFSQMVSEVMKKYRPQMLANIENNNALYRRIVASRLYS